MMMLVTFHIPDDADSASKKEAFETALKSLGSWSNRLPGAWLLETGLSPRQVRDVLGGHMKNADRLFIAEIKQNWSGRGMGEGFPQWMERRKFA